MRCYVHMRIAPPRCLYVGGGGAGDDGGDGVLLFSRTRVLSDAAFKGHGAVLCGAPKANNTYTRVLKKKPTNNHNNKKN